VLWGNIYRFDTLSIGFPLAEHKTLAILRLNGLVGNATDYNHATDSAAKSYIPRGNGQVTRMHKIIVPMLAKLSLESAGPRYKHVA